jgi:probable HAF family extracellular repeat protein
MGINDRGEVVGMSSLANGDGHAFYSDGNHVLDLGTLAGPNILGFGLGMPADSAAYGINNAGTIVGSAGYSGYQGHGFLYADGHMSDINDLLAANDTAAWVITDAMAINDSGIIAAYGYQKGIYRGTTLLLTPHNVPEPLSATLLVIGILGMGAAKRMTRASSYPAQRASGGPAWRARAAGESGHS